MKKILLLLLSFTFIKAQSQSLEEIIQKYSDAAGGVQIRSAVKTVKMTGNASTQGMDLPLTIQIINGKAVRTDVEAMGQTITNIYKDGKGWAINPLAGATTPVEVTGDDLTDLKDEAILVTPLMNYKERDLKAELLGQEDVDGVNCFKIKLTRNDTGKESFYYISSKDYLLLKYSSTKEIMGQSTTIDSYYSDYKDFNGIKFSMTQTQKIEGQVFQEVKITDIQLNVPIDEKVFDI